MSENTGRGQLLRRIRSLQNSKNYADEVESARLEKKIDALLKRLDALEKKTV